MDLWRQILECFMNGIIVKSCLINELIRLIMAVSGESGDAQQFAEYVHKNISLYKMRNG